MNRLYRYEIRFRTNEEAQNFYRSIDYVHLLEPNESWKIRDVLDGHTIVVHAFEWRWTRDAMENRAHVYGGEIVDYRAVPKSESYKAVPTAQRKRDLTPRAHRARGKHKMRRKAATRSRVRLASAGKSFDDTLAAYVARLQTQERGNARYSIETGRRYTRLVRASGGERSVVSFIDTNGDILKAASWKGPVKGARGNIFRLNLES